MNLPTFAKGLKLHYPNISATSIREKEFVIYFKDDKIPEWLKELAGKTVEVVTNVGEGKIDG